MRSLLVLLAVALPLSGSPVAQSSLINTIDASQFLPPSPDTAGLAYDAAGDRLLMCDSEVNEVVIYAGVNVWETTRGGVALATADTTLFSNEPTGVAYNPADGHWFFSDDNARRVYEVDPGTDGQVGTVDDTLTSFSTLTFGSNDPEGLAFDTLQGHLFIADGVNAEIYEIAPGPNGLFDGVAPDGDDVLTQFDTAGLDVFDPEGVEHSAADDTLFIVDQSTKTVIQTTRGGLLILTIDLGFLNPLNPAGITYAPGSVNPGVKSLYIADRGVDNGQDPDENDGRVYEITLPSNEPGTYDARVATRTDDAEERASGSMSLGSGDLDMVFDTDTGNTNTTGIRFVDVGVPQGALVENAYIQFAVDEIDSVPTSLTIHGQAADDAPAFASNAGNISSRPLTVASVAWSPPSWNVVGDQGPDQRTPDLSAVLQEIVNRPGWQACNPVALIISGSGERVAESHDGNNSRRPLLHVEYDPAGCDDLDADEQTICHCDCDDTDPTAWSVPSGPRNLRFAGDKQTLIWDVPQWLGGPAPLYDTIRSDDPADFVVGATCVESDDASDTAAVGPGTPALGAVFHYVVRAENNCGDGPSGTASSGVERPARDCP